MGFNEDDRIRAKNTAHNLAYQLYLNLKNEGLTNTEIASYVLNTNHIRKDILSSVLCIVGGSNEDKVGNTHNTGGNKLLQDS
jgi:hypothetical protein